MRLFGFLLLAPLLVFANEQEIQRALIQRDQQSAEFAAGVNRPALESLHYRQNQEMLGREVKPYDRERFAREREGFVLQLPPPRVIDTQKPLPLPGGPRHGVDPVPSQRLGG